VTFKEIQDDTLDKLLYDNSGTSSAPRTRIKRLINQWHRKILSDPRYSKLRDSRTSVVTVASQVLYAVPPSIEKIHRVFDAATNNPRLTQKSLDWLRDDPRADLDTGTPMVWVPHGIKPIFRYPATTGIWAVSPNAADTTQNIRMDAVRDGGYVFSAGPTTLTGTTRVKIGTQSDYVDVERVFLSAACAGDISLFDASTAGNLLGVIPIGKTFNRYNIIQFYPVPSSVITYTIEGQLKIQDLVQDNDEPMIPEDFHFILGLGAYYQELRDVKKQLAQARMVQSDELDPAMKRLLGHLVNQPDYVVIPDDGRRVPSGVRGSNLGSWYPSGRW